MNRISKAIKARNDRAFPRAIWQRAHELYPAAICRRELYAAAWFGHRQTGNISTGSVWRGCVRRALREAY